MAQVELKRPESLLRMPASEATPRLFHDTTAHSLFLRCPTCASDLADTLGVTGTLGATSDATVVMRCKDCSTVYVSPAEQTGSAPGLPAYVLTLRRLQHWARDLPPSARVLCIDCAAELAELARSGPLAWTIERTEEAGEFDLIVVARSLESTMDPNALLHHAAALLRRGGRVLVIVGNADASCFALFGGRHWSGYQYPHTRQHWTPQALRYIADRAGLRVRQLDTLFVPSIWLTSIANWLLDWGAGKSMIAVLTRWWLPKTVTSIFEGAAVMRGHGAMLVANLEKP